jgi:hypothetical protein
MERRNQPRKEGKGRGGKGREDSKKEGRKESRR